MINYIANFTTANRKGRLNPWLIVDSLSLPPSLFHPPSLSPSLSFLTSHYLSFFFLALYHSLSLPPAPHLSVFLPLSRLSFLSCIFVFLQLIFCPCLYLSSSSSACPNLTLDALQSIHLSHRLTVAIACVE